MDWRGMGAKSAPPLRNQLRSCVRPKVAIYKFGLSKTLGHLEKIGPKSQKLTKILRCENLAF